MPPGISRLVSRNLLLSATRAMSPDRCETGTAASNLRDLCTLINLSVLYEKLETIGHTSELSEHSKPDIKAGYDQVQEMTGLRIEIGPTDKELHDVLNTASSLATLPFARAGKDVSTSALKQRLSGSFRREVSDTPDYWEDFAEGQKLAMNTEATTEERLRSGEAFWFRSFLYAAFSQVRRIPFVPDTIRMWGMRDSPSDDSYSHLLQEVVEEKYPPQLIDKVITDAPISIPPFAAAVFVRAGSDPSRVIPELKGLREEMASVRQALAYLQQEKEWGEYVDGFQTIFAPQASPDSKISVDAKTRKALDKLSNLKVPLPPQLLKLQPLFSVIKASASLLINLIGPVPNWPDGFKDTRDLIEKTLELKSWDDDYAFAEVHNRLGWDLRGFFRNNIKLENLFGKIHDDDPSGLT